MAVDWDKWRAIAQIASAVGTFAAVITSLYLARQSSRPKLTVAAGIRLMIAQGQEGPFPKYISIEIRNVGVRDVYVDQLGWRIGRWPFSFPNWLARGFAVQTFGTVPESQNPPFELPQGRKATAMLRLDQSLENILIRDGEEPLFAKLWPFLGIQRSPVFMVVFLSSGERITARVERDLESRLLSAERSKRLAIDTQDVANATELNSGNERS